MKQLKKLMINTYKKIWEIPAVLFTFRCPYTKEKMTREYKNLFYSRKTKLYQFRPQPSPLLWKMMHRFTLLRVYHEPEKQASSYTSAHKLYHLLEQYATKGKLFDVGANGGNLMLIGKQRGWRVDGNEISKKAIAWGKEHNKLKIRYGYFEELPLRENHYTAIIMRQVIEHTHDPLEVLMKANRALTPGGVLVIETPIKTKQELRNYYELFHLSEFTKEGLNRLVEKAGFEKVYEHTHTPKGNCRLITALYKKPIIKNTRHR